MKFNYGRRKDREFSLNYYLRGDLVSCMAPSPETATFYQRTQTNHDAFKIQIFERSRSIILIVGNSESFRRKLKKLFR